MSEEIKPVIDPTSDESAIVRVLMLARNAPLSDAFCADLERVCALAARAHDGDGWRDIESADVALQKVRDVVQAFPKFSDDKPFGYGLNLGDLRAIAAMLPAPPQSTLEQESKIKKAFYAGWDECDSLHQNGRHPFCATVEEAWRKYNDTET